MIDKSSEIAQILLDLGAQPGDCVGQAISGIWDSYADKALIGPRLQSLYTRRAAVDILLGSVWRDVDTSDEQQSVALRQQSDQLSTIRQSVEAQINALLSQLQAARAPATGSLTSTAPVPGPSLGPDPNSIAYRGSPLCAPWKGV